MKNEKLITVLTFTYAHEVAVIRSRLEAEGIFCFAKDELTAQVSPFYSNAIGGVKLQVRESDLQQTVEILKEAGYIRDENLPLTKDDKHADYQQALIKNGKITCPICGSEEVSKSKKAGWFFLITSLLLIFPTPFFQKMHYCFDCKQKFKLKRK